MRVLYWKVADTFLVSGDSFIALRFPAVSRMAMKICERLLQALLSFSTPRTRVFFCVQLPVWLLCDCTRRRLYTDLIVIIIIIIIIIIIMIMIVITILLILSSYSLHPKRKSYLNNKELTGSFFSSLSKSILTRVLLTLSASERAISPPTYGSLLRRSTLRIVLLSAITSARAIIPTKIREY